MVLKRDFYLRDDVVEIAKDLLGRVIVTRIDGGVTAGVISETEAYKGIVDRASHSYGGRRTERTEVMYAIGGTAYIYLCYGVHSLFNVVTNVKEIPDAVLVRGILPLEGIRLMQERTGKHAVLKGLADGPGKVSKALGIHYSDSGLDLIEKDRAGRDVRIWIEDRGITVDPAHISVTPRIGVQYAGSDAALPWRFLWNK